MRPSAETSHDLARPGTMRASGVKRVSPSKRYETARPVGTSVESAGSSDLGSYVSRESTSVFLEGADSPPPHATIAGARRRSRGRMRMLVPVDSEGQSARTFATPRSRLYSERILLPPKTRRQGSPAGRRCWRRGGLGRHLPSATLNPADPSRFECAARRGECERGGNAGAKARH